MVCVQKSYAGVYIFAYTICLCIYYIDRCTIDYTFFLVSLARGPMIHNFSNG